VDAWLLDLESAMRTTLHSHIASSLAEYPSDASFEANGNWEQWMQKWEGQVVLAVSQIMWTAAVSKALSVTCISQKKYPICKIF
jgi:dynein heavy chain